MGVKNVEHLHIWSLGAANTGLSGTMSATLVYFADESTTAAATEAVTIAEISGGHYAFYYTPTSVGTYKLKAAETTLVAEEYFEDIVSDAPTAAAAGDSYCAESDVCALTGVDDYSATTRPTETQVLTFMLLRAAEIYARLRKIMGTSAVGPTNYDAPIDTSDDKGLALSRVCKMANAIGAAMDALAAAGAGEQPNRSERVVEYGAMYATFFMDDGALDAAARAYMGSASIAATHISTGEVTEKSMSPVEEQGLVFTTRTQF